MLLVHHRAAVRQNAAGSVTERVTRQTTKVAEYPVIPPELWPVIMGWCEVWELGGW